MQHSASAEASIDITAPLDYVWKSVFPDFDKPPATRLTEGPLAPGTQWRISKRGLGNHETIELVRYDPPREFILAFFDELIRREWHVTLAQHDRVVTVCFSKVHVWEPTILERTFPFLNRLRERPRQGEIESTLAHVKKGCEHGDVRP